MFKAAYVRKIVLYRTGKTTADHESQPSYTEKSGIHDPWFTQDTLINQTKTA